MTEVREVGSDEIRDFFATVWRSFGGPRPGGERMEKRIPSLLRERPLAVFEEGRIVATARALRYEMTLPGGSALPTAGVASVAVLPTHRRRGLLTALMRKQLDDFHAGGEPIAALFASEGSIYRRFGFGISAYESEVEIERHRSDFRIQWEGRGRVSFADGGDAIDTVAAVWERARSAQPGMMAVERETWERRLQEASDDKPARHVAVYVSDTRPEGFAVYRKKIEWRNDFQPDGSVQLEFLIATTNDAYAALWRHCLDSDLTVRLQAERRPLLEPLRFLLSDPRAMRAHYHDNLWVRLVDVSTALAGRAYEGEGALVFEVIDAFCPWNEGRYRLEAGPQPGCARTSARADIRLDVAELAACYLGGNRFTTLRDAGVLEELTAGSAEKADRLFASDPLPWCPLFF